MNSTMSITPQGDRSYALADRTAEWQAIQMCDLTKLKNRDAQILKYYYERNLSLQGVADQVGASREGVRKAIARLKQKLIPQLDQNQQEDPNTAFMSSYFPYLGSLPSKLERLVVGRYYNLSQAVGEIAQLAEMDFLEVSRLKNRGETKLRLIKASCELEEFKAGEAACRDKVTVVRCSHYGVIEAFHKEVVEIWVNRDRDGVGIRFKSMTRAGDPQGRRRERVHMLTYEMPVLFYRDFLDIQTEADLYKNKKNLLFGAP